MSDILFSVSRRILNILNFSLHNSNDICFVKKNKQKKEPADLSDDEILKKTGIETYTKCTWMNKQLYDKQTNKQENESCPPFAT